MKLDGLLEIENKYGLLDLHAQDFYYWVYFRRKVYNQIREKEEGVNLEHPINNAILAKKIFRLLLLLRGFFDIKHRPNMQSDYLFLNDGRRVLDDGIYVNITSDPIISQFPDSIMFEFPYGGKHFSPRQTTNVIFGDKYSFLAVASAFLKRYLIRRKEFRAILQKVKSDLAKPLQEMCEDGRISIDTSKLFVEIATNYYVYLSFRKSYKSVLDTIRPQVLVIEGHYDIMKMVFIELAKERNIPTIELQHGMVWTPAYNYYKKREIHQFPDYFFTFSKYWNTQARFPIDDQKIITVGFPYGENRAKKIRKQYDRSDKKIILVLSDFAVAKELSSIAVELNRIIDHSRFRIIYKLHPAEYNNWEKNYNNLVLEQEIEVAGSTEYDLYELFAMSSYMVASGSTMALYEGFLYDLPAFIYYPSAWPEFKELCDLNYATRFDHVNELYNLLLGQSDSNYQDENRFWETDSLEKMKSEIEIIANKKGISCEN